MGTQTFEAVVREEINSLQETGHSDYGTVNSQGTVFLDLGWLADATGHSNTDTQQVAAKLVEELDVQFSFYSQNH